MLLDLVAIVGSNLDVDADHSPLLHRLAEARIKDERTAVGDTRLHDDVRLDAIDRFLDPENVFGELDDRPAHPCEAVRILAVPSELDP